MTPPKRSNSTDTYTVGTNVTVVVRVRPLNVKEQDCKINSCLRVDNNVVSVRQCMEFIFDHCIKPYEDNQYLYSQIGEPSLNHALDGYNVCMFAYGQTGSGKTHSILGREDDPGLMHQFVINLFDRIALESKKNITFKVECSYYEIYNEKIHDLLGNDPRTPLRVREHPLNGPYIVDLSTIECTSYQDVVYWINLAQKRRLTACTLMNQKSSRSHTIFTLNITQDTDLDNEFHQSITSKVNIVDLAGSERVHSTICSNERLKESVLINKSLLTLGKVITQLAEYEFVRGSASNYISYRESVLTWLLRESLGGNSKTTMIATVSPASIHQDETLTTLRYAATARRVVNIVKINEDPKIRRIRELEQEVELLRQKLLIVDGAKSVSPQIKGQRNSKGRLSCSLKSEEDSHNLSKSFEVYMTPPKEPYANHKLLMQIKEMFKDILNN